MSRSTLGAVLLLSLFSGALPSTVASAQQPAEPPGALPYDLAFDLREFLWSAALAATPDGRRIAYEVRQPPPDSNLNARYLPNGSPASVVGTRIAFTDRVGGRTIEICPGGNCWRPSWSPDGTMLAFYSDADGPPQLWVYELARARSRRLSTQVVKPKLCSGDEPRWSPDGRTIYVPLAPEGEYRSPAGSFDEARVALRLAVVRTVRRDRGVLSAITST